MYKKLVAIAFVFIACIDFDIDAPYDDINGVILEHIRSYDFPGKKIVIDNEKGYIVRRDDTDIVCYDLTDVYNIDTFSVYRSVYTKPDFTIANGYAYIVSQNFGLEIVNFNQTTPQLTGFLPISGDVYSIILSDDRAFVAAETKLYSIDVSDVTNPVHITEYTFNDSIINAQIVSDTLYILLDGGILQIIDIAAPTDPQLIAQHNLSDSLDQAYDFVKYNTYLYVTKGYGIDAYALQENGNVEYLNTLSFSHGITFLQTFENFGICLYDGYSFNRLYILNLTYPSRPCIGEYLDLEGRPSCAVINNQYIYLLLSPSLNIYEIEEIE